MPCELSGSKSCDHSESARVSLSGQVEGKERKVKALCLEKADVSAGVSPFDESPHRHNASADQKGGHRSVATRVLAFVAVIVALYSRHERQGEQGNAGADRGHDHARGPVSLVLFDFMVDLPELLLPRHLCEGGCDGQTQGENGEQGAVHVASGGARDIAGGRGVI